MIVGSFFEGDVDMEVAGKQHDVYSQALGIIVSRCNLYAEFARFVLDDTGHREWGRIDRFDHRTLQHAHDLLVAVWRFRHDYRQLALPFMRKEPLDETPRLWLDWLRREVEGWIRYPDRVRLVQLILTNQNERRGYLAEAELSVNIMDGFTDVPWDRKWREAYEDSLAHYREGQGG